MISCEVALKSDSTASSSSSVDKDDSSSASSALPEEAKKIGARVRVKVPLKVYHVPRVPEVDLTGMEGELKQYVGLWKGKRISANFPFKVEFRTEIEGRGPVKFFAHLKEDEFEYLWRESLVGSIVALFYVTSPTFLFLKSYYYAFVILITPTY